MTSYELLSVIISSLSAIIAIVSVGFTCKLYGKANRLSAQYNNLVTAQVELQMSTLLTAARNRVEDLCLNKPPKKELEEDQEKLNNYSQALVSAMENLVNAYEEACAKYLDKKIDCDRFKKTYQKDIRQLVDDESHKMFFDPIRSSYKAVLKVYNEWENQEK